MKRVVVLALVLVLAALCVWLASIFATPTADDAQAPNDGASRDASTTSERRATARHAAVALDAKPEVQIDDGELPAGAKLTIRGFVRDKDGAPIAGATVNAARSPVSGWAGGVHHATTGADGGYVLDALDANTVWSVAATAPGFAVSPWASAVVASHARLEFRYDFVLAKFEIGSIELVVRDESGAAVAYDSRVLPATVTASSYQYFVDQKRLLPGRYRVWVASRGYAPEIREVDVAAGAPTRAEFRLAPGATISGRLVAADGEPMQGFVVGAANDEEWALPPQNRDVTKTDGSFHFAGLRRARYVVRLSDADVVVESTGPFLAPADGVTLKVCDDATATFHLVYPSEFTPEQRTSDVTAVEIVDLRERVVSPRWDYDRGAVNVPAGTDVELCLNVRGCVQARRRFTVRAGDTLDLGDVVLVAERAITGRVVDAAGLPVPAAIVEVRGGPTGSRAMTGPDGRFAIPHLPPGDVVLDATDVGLADTTARGVAGQAEPIVIVLRRGGRLVVHADDASGAPFVGATAKLVPKSGDPRSWRLDAFGEWTDRLAAGTWRVEIAGCPVVETEVREGATTTVRVRAATR